MLRVGFVLPSSEFLHDPFRGDPHTHFQILTVLEDRFGSRLEICLPDLRGVRREFAPYRLPECDIYLHSVYTLDFHEQVGLVRVLKERFPGARHIAGGAHAVEFQTECLETFDALVVGEGEELVVQALEDVLEGRLERVYAQRERVDINRYPHPRRHWLPAATVARRGPGLGLLSLKSRSGLENLLSTTAIFSRGCPYRCHFCHIPRGKGLEPGIRHRAPHLVEEEIEYLKRAYRVEALNLFDEIAIPLSRNRAIAHLEAIGRTGILWKAQCRVDGLTPELARLAAQSGCVIMAVGVESVSQLSLDLINKRIRVDQARSTIRLLKENGIEVRLYMIVGLPGEPPDIVERTWDFIRETEPDLVYLSLLTLRPGTEMYRHPEKFGMRLEPGRWDDTMHLFGRYGEETPTLTFEYREDAPWGRAPSRERIIANYLELQQRLKTHDLCTR